MLNHGINILALWIIVDIIEKKTGVRKISELGGLGVKSPALAIFLVIIAFANIALPLSNSFVSEFLMFNGLFTFNKWYCRICLYRNYSFSGVYVDYGAKNFLWKNKCIGRKSKANEHGGQNIVLLVLVVSILVLGIYPEPVIHLTESTVTDILSRIIK